MAQLVKLLDYISRYESNPFHYPAQYIRLKQENWRKLLEKWDTESLELENEIKETDDEESKTKRAFIWNPFKKQQQPSQQSAMEDGRQTNETLPKSKKELTYYFLNKLYPLQIKWATSTISHTSYTTRNFERDEILKYFLQRFPDIYLLMYFPIMNIRNLPVDADIILISPLGIEIIVMLDPPKEATIVTTDDRVWTIEDNSGAKKIISPTISLRRTEHIVQSILQKYQLDFPIIKTVLARHNKILTSAEPYQVNMIDQRKYEDWFTEKRALHSSLKSVQLKVMDALLKHCQTTAIPRPEWSEEKVNQNQTMDTEDA